MAIGLLLSLVLRADQRIPAASGLCKRVRLNNSDCRRCLDVCPESAISLDPGPSVDDRCSGCGLCQTVCPTEVFQGHTHTDQHFLGRIGPLLKEDRAAPEHQRLFVYCQQAEKPKQESFPVPCLGSITENFMLGAALRGVDELVFAKGICSQCRLKHGAQIFHRALATFRILSGHLGLDPVPVSVDERQKTKSVKLSRRALFSSDSREQGNRVESERDSGNEASEMASGGADSNDVKTRLSPRRRYLQMLFDRQVPPQSAIVNCGQEFPWAKINIDERKCVACGICVALCPTGAITRKQENAHLSHYFNASFCTNCGLCNEACPEHAISFERNVPLSDLLASEAEAITRIPLNSCLICGEVIPATEGEICMTCEKRQMSSKYARI